MFLQDRVPGFHCDDHRRQYKPPPGPGIRQILRAFDTNGDPQSLGTYWIRVDSIESLWTLLRVPRLVIRAGEVWTGRERIERDAGEDSCPLGTNAGVCKLSRGGERFGVSRPGVRREVGLVLYFKRAPLRLYFCGCNTVEKTVLHTCSVIC
jgi:hypothetical protein